MSCNCMVNKQLTCFLQTAGMAVVCGKVEHFLSECSLTDRFCIGKRQ